MITIETDLPLNTAVYSVASSDLSFHAMCGCMRKAGFIPGLPVLPHEVLKELFLKNETVFSYQMRVYQLRAELVGDYYNVFLYVRLGAMSISLLPDGTLNRSHE